MVMNTINKLCLYASISLGEYISIYFFIILMLRFVYFVNSYLVAIFMIGGTFNKNKIVLSPPNKIGPYSNSQLKGH